MKTHPTASAVSIGRRDAGGALEGAANHRTASTEDTSKPGQSEPGSAAGAASARAYTLILIGELDRRSAHVLEEEIERLCEEDVAAITLDLRELTYIDSVGAAAIAFRCELCKRRGHDIALIPGSADIHRAFERAGISDVLPFRKEDAATPRRLALVLGERSRDGG